MAFDGLARPPAAAHETVRRRPNASLQSRPPKTKAGWSLTSTSSEVSHDMAFDGPVKPAPPKPNKADPLEGRPTARTPINKLITQLKDDDASLTVLKLDGRKKVSPDDWEEFFEALEENETLTHLSLCRCNLTDDEAVSLVLALVENGTLVSLKVSDNKKLTDDTAKGFIKVLEGSNHTLKKLDVAKTKITEKSIAKLDEILEERDEEKQRSKVQAERQERIKNMLAVTATKDAEAEEDANEEKSCGSGRSGKAGKSPDKSRKSGKKRGEVGGTAGEHTRESRQSPSRDHPPAVGDGESHVPDGRGHRQRRRRHDQAQGGAQAPGGMRDVRAEVLSEVHVQVDADHDSQPC